MLLGVPTNFLTGSKVLCTKAGLQSFLKLVVINLLHPSFLPHHLSRIHLRFFTKAWYWAEGHCRQYTNNTPASSSGSEGTSSLMVLIETKAAPDTAHFCRSHLPMLFRTHVLITASRLFTLCITASLLLLAFTWDTSWTQCLPPAWAVRRFMACCLCPWWWDPFHWREYSRSINPL